jgi:UDP-GlcNAc:undecaprenyl-phosphate/decaprenyl-phosphate GlcNAc-1-phosphate transferase
MLVPLSATFGASFALCLVLTPLARTLALRWKLLDRPDQRRKMHGRTVPVAGGLPILFSSCAALALMLAVSRPLWAECTAQAVQLGGLLVAAVLICALGLLDDFGCLRGRHKLVGQAAAVAVVIACGVVVRNITVFEYEIELGLLAYPFTVFVLLGAVNSLNLIDGMDGLLSSMGLIIVLALAGVAVLGDHWTAAFVALALGGALLAFLFFNFPPASIFLGDSGSMLIGLVVGVLAIQSSLKGPATIALATPTALLIIPLFDTTAAILRRKLTGRSIYDTDRGHLHHCLLRRGFKAYHVLLLVSGFCLFTVAGVLASLTLKNESLAVLSAVTVVSILVVTRLFGFGELTLLGQRLRSLLGSFRPRRGLASDPPATRGNHSAVRLQGSLDWNELWVGVQDLSGPLNLKALRLDVNAPAIQEGYNARWDSTAEGVDDRIVWRAEIPLEVRKQVIGRLEVIGYQDDEPVWKKIVTLAKLVQGFETTAMELMRPAQPKPENPKSEIRNLKAEAVHHAGGR